MNRHFSIIAFFVLVLQAGAPARQIGGGDLLFKPGDVEVKQVLFSHEQHVIEKRLSCSSCHYLLFQMAKGSSRIGLNRIAKGELRGKCHNGKNAFSAKEAKNCVRCHR